MSFNPNSFSQAHLFAILLFSILLPTLSMSSQTDDLVQRSLLSLGNPTQLKRVFNKAGNGDNITLAVIGGSITAGAGAVDKNNAYVNLLLNWWRRKYPRANIQMINAGIGATGSDYGVLRLQRDVLAFHPDLVLVEFAVNDQNSETFAETYEGIIRQLLVAPDAPAVVLLFMMGSRGTSAQDWQAQVGSHYSLPMVSYRDALWPEILAGRLTWNEIGADAVHPKDAGHIYAARFVENLLETAQTSAVETTDHDVQTLPAPLLTATYEHTSLLEAANLTPTFNEGWQYDPASKSWHTGKPGSIIEFEIRGRQIFFMDYHVKGPMGMVRLQVDSRATVIRDGWFEQTWGGYRSTLLLGKDLEPGLHRVRIESLAERNPKSDGFEFRILGFGSAGMDAAKNDGSASMVSSPK